MEGRTCGFSSRTLPFRNSRNQSPEACARKQDQSSDQKERGNPPVPPDPDHLSPTLVAKLPGYEVVIVEGLIWEIQPFRFFVLFPAAAPRFLGSLPASFYRANTTRVWGWIRFGTKPTGSPDHHLTTTTGADVALWAHTPSSVVGRPPGPPGGLSEVIP